MTPDVELVDAQQRGSEATDRKTTDLDALTSQLDRAHVFHSWSAQGALQPFVLAGGQGCRVWDDAGNRYLDFSSQLVNLNIGHQHPKVVAAIVEQAQTLATVASRPACSWMAATTFGCW